MVYESGSVFGIPECIMMFPNRICHPKSGSSHKSPLVKKIVKAKRMVAIKNKYFVFGILALPNGVPFSEVTLTGGARTSKIATSASASVVEEIRSDRFSFEIYAGPQESQRLQRMGRDFDHVNPYGWRFLQGIVHPIASFLQVLARYKWL